MLPSQKGSMPLTNSRIGNTQPFSAFEFFSKMGPLRRAADVHHDRRFRDTVQTVVSRRRLTCGSTLRTPGFPEFM
jgi:hypothetical protein